MNKRYLIQILVLLALFLLSVFGYESIKEWLYHLFNKAYLLEDTGYAMNLPLLTWQHIEMSFLACSASVIIGVILGTIAVSKAAHSRAFVHAMLVCALYLIVLIGISLIVNNGIMFNTHFLAVIGGIFASGILGCIIGK